MEKDTPKNGLESILLQYKKNFRISENLDYYSQEDLKKAEKKFVKLCITHGYYWCHIGGSG